ncbi:LysE family translocator [Pelagibacterium sp. H642]|uniref:LysE family translocator n=1 Tax=Pelagibacterium sp. H642 TaxID=1881069 RepID=UPI002815A5BA|nr:LysE family translocator [Pelagibacterium sp. H642]WMT90544.1 LysE family translocator [Pelagibacterium sp. H642]
MLEFSSLLAFLLASFFIAVVPGPTVTVIIASALARGTVAGMAIILGTQLGLVSMILVVALGMEAVMSVMGWAFDWIKMIGAAYLVWLGYKMLRSSGRIEAGEAERHRTLRGYVMQGFIVIWSNPKALLMFGAFLPQFVVESSAAFPQILLLGGLFMLATTLSDSVYAVLAGQARHWISSARVRLVNRVSGAVLIGGGIWLALQRRA